uniref:General secretion pathway protein GspM n=1 Tax=Rhodopseudomonas palustris (strain BisA53) TaxID=316055 RepID=Q07N82_RHOP5
MKIPDFDRRIAAPALCLCTLAGTLFCLIAGEFDLHATGLEYDAKTELLERLSPGGARRAGILSGAASQHDANLFVVAETATTAAAEVDRLVRAIVSKDSSTVLSTQATIEQGDGPASRRIELQATIEGRIEAIQRVLFNLETSAPMMLVDTFTMQPIERGASRKEAQAPLLQATLTLSAYWRRGT